MKQRRALVYTEGRSICLQSWNDLADRYKIWSWGICGRTQAERKIKSGKNQAKKKKNFRDGHSLRGCSEKFLVVHSRTNQLRIKRHDHNVTGTHRVWNFANGSHWENVSSTLTWSCIISLHFPNGYIFYLTGEIAFCLSLSFTLTSCHSISKGRMNLYPLYGFRIWTKGWTKGETTKFSNEHYWQ